MIIYVFVSMQFHIFSIFSVSISGWIFDHIFNGKWLLNDLQNWSPEQHVRPKRRQGGDRTEPKIASWNRPFWTTEFSMICWRHFGPVCTLLGPFWLTLGAFGLHFGSFWLNFAGSSPIWRRWWSNLESISAGAFFKTFFGRNWTPSS